MRAHGGDGPHGDANLESKAVIPTDRCWVRSRIRVSGMNSEIRSMTSLVVEDEGKGEPLDFAVGFQGEPLMEI